MLTTQERIAKLQAQVGERAKKLDEAKAELEKMKVEEARKKADADRKADANSKLLIGAGVQLLPPPIRSRVVVTVLGVLSERDRERVKPWVGLRDVDLGALPLVMESPAAPIPPVPSKLDPVADPAPVKESEPVDPVPAALLRVLGSLDSMRLAYMEAEFLGAASEEDRPIMERLFADLSAAAVEKASASEGGEDRESSLPASEEAAEGSGPAE